VEKSSLGSLSKSITSILTLRYNYGLESSLPKLSWQNFHESKTKASPDFIEKLLVDSMKNSINQDTDNVSISLSGGIDSTLMLALLQKNFPKVKINAISMKFSKSNDETPQASNIAKHFGISHKIINLENYLIELPKAISIIKQPFWDLHWYHIVKNANADYLVSGDGGDELFGGYTFRYKKYLSSVSNGSDWKDKVKLYLNCHERDWVPDQEDLFGNKSEFTWDKIYYMLKPYFDNPLCELEKVFLADYNGKLLHNFHPINSVFHQYFDTKSITPLLDKKIINLAVQIDPKLKYNQDENTGKIPLRKILSKYLDTDSVIATKQGFSVNTQNLWKDYGFRLCQKHVIEGNICKEGWINDKWISQHFKKDLEDIRYINKFLGLLAFEIWYRLFVTKEITPDTKLS